VETHPVPVPPDEPVDRPGDDEEEHEEGDRQDPDEHPDVVHDVVAHLVRHDEGELVGGEFFEDRVPHHDPLAPEQPRDVRVHLGRLLAHVDLVDPASRYPRLLRHGEDPLSQDLVLERFVRVEEGIEIDRSDDDHDDHDRYGGRRHPEPPVLWTAPNPPVGERDEKDAEDVTDEVVLQKIGDPFPEGFDREFEIVLDDECPNLVDFDIVVKGLAAECVYDITTYLVDEHTSNGWTYRKYMYDYYVNPYWGQEPIEDVLHRRVLNINSWTTADSSNNGAYGNVYGASVALDVDSDFPATEITADQQGEILFEYEDVHPWTARLIILEKSHGTTCQ